MTWGSDEAGHDVLAGRLLSYCAAGDVDLIDGLLRAHPATGLVVRGAKACDVLAQLPESGSTHPLVVDLGAWAGTEASVEAPMCLPVDGLFPVDLDMWASSLIDHGASVVLTPSLFVRCADWAALRAVLRTGATTSRSQVRTLVPTDAAMLEPALLGVFLRVLTEHAGGRRLVFVFADRKEPLAGRDRMVGLRSVLVHFPGSLVMGADVLAATDVVARGGVGAVGLTGSLRRPRRPGDRGGPPAKGWIPGLFLRQMWETRSPSVYADWFANSPSPTCSDCGGRALDGFSADPNDKRQVLRHNVHAWLDVHTEITRRQPAAAKEWLHWERCRGLAAHAALRPVPARLKADALLRALCELDDPQQRRITPTGDWR